MHLNLENDKCITYQAWFTVQKPGRRLRKWASRLFNPSTFSFRPITHIFRSKVILVIRKCNFFIKIGDCISARIYCWLQKKKKKYWVQKRDLINLVSGFMEHLPTMCLVSFCFSSFYHCREIFKIKCWLFSQGYFWEHDLEGVTN